MARNKKSEIDRIKAMAWFRAVAISTGIPKAYGLELKFDKNKTKIVNKKLMRPRKWDAWRDGKRTPSKSEVDRIEFSVPGCARWFYHPIWNLLNKVSAFNSVSDIDTVLLKLPTVQFALFDSLYESDELVRIPPQYGYLIVHHIQANEYEPDSLACYDDLDKLAALLALAREAKLLNNAKSRREVLDGYFESKPAICKIPELCGVTERLFTYIEKHDEWSYPKPRAKTISEVLGGLNMPSLKTYSLYLFHQRCPWTSENLALLGKMSDVALARKLRITTERVRYRRKEHKIAKFIDPRFLYLKDHLDLLQSELNNKKLAIQLRVSIDTIKRYRKKKSL